MMWLVNLITVIIWSEMSHHTLRDQVELPVSKHFKYLH